MSWGFTPLLPASAGLLATTGPVTHDVTITEAATAGESSTRAILTDSSQTEAASAGDTPSGSFVAPASITDAAAADESSTRASSTNSSQTEAATAGDTSTGLSLAAAEITEASTAGEVSTRVSITDSTQTEAVTASDTPNGSLVAVADLTDAASAGESSSSSVSIASESTEPVTIGESSTSESSPGAATTETVSAAEAQAGTRATLAVSLQPTADNLAFSSAYMPNGVGNLVAMNQNVGFGTIFKAAASISVKRVSIGMLVYQAGDPTKTWPAQPGTVEVWTMDAANLYANPQTKLGQVSFDLQTLSTTASWHEFDFSGVSGVNLTKDSYYMVILRSGSDWNTASTKMIMASAAYYYDPSGVDYLIASNDYSINVNVPSYNTSFYQRSQYVLALQMVQGQSSVVESPLAGLTLSGPGAEAITASDSSVAVFPATAAQSEAAALTDAQTSIAAIGVAASEAAALSHSQDYTQASYARGNDGNWLVDIFEVTAGSGPTFGSSGGRVNVDNSVSTQFIAGKSGRVGTVYARCERYEAWTTDGAVELWQLASNSVTALPQTLLASVPLRSSDIPNNSVSTFSVDFSQLAGANVTAGVGYALVFKSGSDWLNGITIRNFVANNNTYGQEVANYAALSYAARYGTYGSWGNLASSTAFGGSHFAVGATLVSNSDALAGSAVSSVAQADTASATDASTAVMPTSAAQSEAAAPTDSQAAAGALNSAATEPVSAATAQTTTLLAVAQVTEPASPGDTPAATLLTTAAATEPASASDGSTSIQSKEAAQAEALALTDAAQTLLAYVASATEALAAVDLPTSTAQVQAAAQETLALLESGASTIDRFADALESATAADASDAATLLVGQLAESLALTTDTAETVTRNLFLDVSENLGGEYALTQTQAALLYQIYLLHGLAGVLEVGPTSRRNGAMQQTVSEAGGTVTVATDAAPSAAGAQVGTMVEELAALHGLTAALEVTDSQRRAGAIVQTISEAGGVTTVTRQT